VATGILNARRCLFASGLFFSSSTIRLLSIRWLPFPRRAIEHAFRRCNQTRPSLNPTLSSLPSSIVQRAGKRPWMKVERSHNPRICHLRNRARPSTSLLSLITWM
jgi:hypothetical protein